MVIFIDESDGFLYVDECFATKWWFTSMNPYRNVDE